MLGDLVQETVALRGDDLEIMRPRDAEALVDERAFAEEDEFLPYWAELWPAGVGLARALDGRALRGVPVLELGCGLGLPSIVAARAGGRVLATDWSAAALELLHDNAARNDVVVETMRADWTRPDGLLARGPSRSCSRPTSSTSAATSRCCWTCCRSSSRRGRDLARRPRPGDGGRVPGARRGRGLAAPRDARPRPAERRRAPLHAVTDSLRPSRRWRSRAS